MIDLNTNFSFSFSNQNREKKKVKLQRRILAIPKTYRRKKRGTSENASIHMVRSGLSSYMM